MKKSGYCGIRIKGRVGEGLKNVWREREEGNEVRDKGGIKKRERKRKVGRRKEFSKERGERDRERKINKRRQTQINLEKSVNATRHGNTEKNIM